MFERQVDPRDGDGVEPGQAVAVTTVAIVSVWVDAASNVVSESTVPVAVITVVPTVDVAMIEPPKDIVVLRTVTAVKVAVVTTGILTTV